VKLTLLTSVRGYTRVESEGEITVLDFSPGAQPIEALLGPEAYSSTVLLNLSKSPYIDSSGVGWLMLCHRRFQIAGGRLVVHSIPPMVNHCFRVLGMYHILNIAPEESAALELATPQLV
jgi:anti-anti-sigma factor